MYRVPSASKTYGPSPRTTVYGVPPTEAKDRTGESTPPGMTRCARANHSAFDAGAASTTDRLGHLCREIGQDEIGSGPLQGHELFECNGRTVDPTSRGGGLHHGVLTTHVIGGQGHSHAAS